MLVGLLSKKRDDSDSGHGTFKELDGASRGWRSMPGLRTVESPYRGALLALIWSEGCEKPLKGFRQGVDLCFRKAALTAEWISVGGRARMKLGNLVMQLLGLFRGKITVT